MTKKPIPAQNNDTILIDPYDLDGLRKIMDEHCHLETMVFGENELGELTAASIFKDQIVVETYQSNGWLRKNIYYRDGSRDEMFNGKWEV